MKFNTLCILTLAALSSLSSPAIAETNKSNDSGIDGFGRIKLIMGSSNDGSNDIPAIGVGFDIMIGNKNFPLYLGISLDMYGNDKNIIKQVDKEYMTNIFKVDSELKFNLLLVQHELSKIYVHLGAGASKTYYKSVKFTSRDITEKDGEVIGNIFSFGTNINYNFFVVGFEAKFNKNKQSIYKYSGIGYKQTTYLFSIGAQF